MNELNIKIEDKVFNIKKTFWGNYEIYPYDEAVSEKDIINAIFEQTNYYATGIQTMIPRKIKNSALHPNVPPYYLAHLELKLKDK